jgi:hypothetical protein
MAVLGRGATVLIADMTATRSCDHAGTGVLARAICPAQGRDEGPGGGGAFVRGHPAGLGSRMAEALHGERGDLWRWQEPGRLQHGCAVPGSRGACRVRFDQPVIGGGAMGRLPGAMPKTISAADQVHRSARIPDVRHRAGDLLQALAAIECHFTLGGVLSNRFGLVPPAAA